MEVFVENNGNGTNMRIQGFVEFVREQGVVGLAIGFLLGGAVSKVVSALVTDIINPIISLGIGSADGLKQASLSIGASKLLWGDFVSTMIDFLIISAVVYFGFKGLGLDKIDKPKEKK
jgi:large conductance mechanosensitive channel